MLTSRPNKLIFNQERRVLFSSKAVPWFLFVCIIATFIIFQGVLIQNQHLSSDQHNVSQLSSPVNSRRPEKMLATPCADPLWHSDKCWVGVDLDQLPSLPALAQRCPNSTRDGSTPKILYAISTMGAWPKTKLHLESLSRIKEKIEILVIDDGSADETVEELKRLKIRYAAPINPPQGVTESWNLGYLFFWAHCYDYIIIANNDVIVPSGAISSMISGLRDSNCTIIGPISTSRGAGSCKKTQGLMNQLSVFGLNKLMLNRAANQLESAQKLSITAINNSTDSVQKLLYQSFNSNKIAPIVKTNEVNGFFFAMQRNSFLARFSEKRLIDPKFRNVGNEFALQQQIVKAIGPKIEPICIARNAFVYHFKASTIPMGIERDLWKKPG